jgi:ABC-type dipeptide/oligopeptide/nickel transport system permease component
MPGLGRLIFLAIGQRDMPVVRVSLLIAFSSSRDDFTVDVICRVVDRAFAGEQI